MPVDVHPYESPDGRAAEHAAQGRPRRGFPGPSLLACCLALAGTALTGPALAAANFVVSGNSANGLVNNATYSTLGAALQSLTPCGAAGYNLQMPGTLVQITFEPNVTNGPGGSSFISVAIPSTGFQSLPVAVNCADAASYLQNLLMSGSQGVTLLRNNVRFAPFSPVAGNPASLLSRAVANDFDALFLPYATNALDGTQSPPLALALNDPGTVRSDAPMALGPGVAGADFRPSPGLGADLSDLHGGGELAQSITLPFATTLRSELDPRRQLSFFAPVSLTSVGGALAYSGSLGASLRLPVTLPWALSATARLGTTSSPDLGASANLGSFALGSTYLFPGRRVDWSIADQVGYYRTVGRSFDNRSPDPQVGAWVTRNGVLASFHGFDAAGPVRSVEASIVQTHYANGGFYSRSETEVSLAAGSNRRADSRRSFVRAHATYLFSAASKGLSVGLGYWF